MQRFNVPMYIAIICCIIAMYVLVPSSVWHQKIYACQEWLQIFTYNITEQCYQAEALSTTYYNQLL